MQSTSEIRPLTKRSIYYFRQRLKNRIFQALLAHFADQAARHGLTRKDLALRLNRDPAQVTRWLSAPSNWTLDTISDLLLAMNSELSAEIASLDSQAESDYSKGLLLEQWQAHQRATSTDHVAYGTVGNP